MARVTDRELNYKVERFLRFLRIWSFVGFHEIFNRHVLLTCELKQVQSFTMVLQSTVIAALASTALAVTSITDGRGRGGGDEPPCYPVWAFGGNVSTPDIYDAAHQTPPAP